MKVPKPHPPTRTELRAPTKPRSEADAWTLLGLTEHPSPSSDFSVDGIRAQALAHAARVLAGWLLPTATSNAHLVIYDLHVWGSSELPELWRSFTQSHVDHFSEEHGAWELRFCGADRGDLSAALALIMMFGWGIAGSDGASARHIRLDHDGIVRLWGGSDEDRSQIEQSLSEVGRS